MLRLALAALAAAAALAAPVALAGGPGAWTPVTDESGINFWQVALARTGDGALHVAWLRKNGSGGDLVHSSLSAVGAPLGDSVPIVSGWASLGENPDLVAMPDGTLRVWFGGIRSTDPTNTNDALNTATAPADGSAWTLQPGRAAPTSTVYTVPVGAGLPGNQPVVAWGDSAPRTNGYHVGLDPATPDTRLQDGCCAYDPDVGADSATGEGVVGWYSNATGESGLLTRTILPTAGSTQYVPGSASADRSSAVSLSQRMPISGRLGAPGVFVAYAPGYPTGTAVALWRHGSPDAPLQVSSMDGAQLVNLAPAPGGRLWIFWRAGDRYYTTRTNRAATRVGPVRALAPPRGASSYWNLTGDASGKDGRLDLLASVTDPGGIRTYHTQVLAPLQLAVSVAAKRKPPVRTITVRVADAADPVRGAKVKLAGRTLTTDAAGRATLAVKPGPRTLAVTASAPGYELARGQASVR